ncbi:hypothetical protein SAMN05443574_10451 [Haloarcula vallismortis]|uniref:Uncharacterized protein n=2 Tax=Haloarcula vallismortis TaxID=28442 RepID=M0J1M8_HALVA|nr:hypothetical protein [Haloarcula vallismortis]EMA01934.1 hypothetical protein C437_15981 [Haloarcula vallismortis ATCC 29715]SDW50523.1 hypothetical protein SAMN05443574_10451 [Haloarcula vallismortis]
MTTILQQLVMLDKIKESVSDVLSGGKRQSDDEPQAGTVTEKRVQASAAGDSGTDAAGEPESNLYECPSCDSVFVAIDKETCASCRTPVERIE